METIEVKFCFKFLKECGVAIDEKGNAVDVFTSISIDVPGALSEEKYQEGQEQFRIALASQVGTDLANIVPITVEEYNAEAYDEDGNQKPNVLSGKAAVQEPEDGPLGEFNSIAHLLPVEVREDVEGRINDWLESGGKSTDRYIINQVEYARRVAKMMEERRNEQVSEESQSES